jgi:hypothetical protein
MKQEMPVIRHHHKRRDLNLALSGIPLQGIRDSLRRFRPKDGTPGLDAFCHKPTALAAIASVASKR